MSLLKVGDVDKYYKYGFEESDDEILGEVVLSDIEEKNCNYRICRLRGVSI